MYCVILFVSLILCTSAAAQTADPKFNVEKPVKRFALVVGNSEYTTTEKLPGVVNDVKTVAAKLRLAGFSVREATNFKTRADFLTKHFLPFVDEVEENSFVVFYFSGHGFTYGGESYLLPLEYPAKVPANKVFDTFVSASALQERLNLRNPTLLVMLLDACRNVGGVIDERPEDRHTLTKGLATLSLVQNNIIGFSSEPGKISLASADGALSKYTEALTRFLTAPGVEFADAQRQIVAHVRRATNSGQSPWVSSSLTLFVHFNPTQATKDDYKVAWLAAQARDTEADVRDYLALYGLGHFAEAARLWLTERSARASTFTRLSPELIDQLWESARATGQVASTELVIAPLGLERTTISTKASKDDSIPQDEFVASALSKQTAVVLGKLTGRAQPDAGAAATTSLDFGDKVKIDSYKVRSGQVWLEAKSKEETFWLALPKDASVKKVELGSPIKEFEIRAGRTAALADERQINSEVAKLPAKSISWISIAIPQRASRTARADRAAIETRARAAHAAFLLSKVVPPGRITLVEGVAEVQEPRVRVFSN
ncbi:caspase family protein [Bradyrhizobium icense]|uniref:Peptidase C14 caspase domain-containing protein n=1 Tax=Bradyrhizobium icense TaxID=1274631 RepID=A0A1B1UBN0_9BRAD|nr:caspase family protein [Bradyrhizobium icense]ANW00175.1 hypothetical protein LMTR13_08275 [Bradyrhizobium icense]